MSIKVKERGVDPTTLVRYGASLRKENGYDHVWCVVDVDQYDLVPAVKAARDEGIELAVSNPCFEFWLLLHFEDCSAHLSCYDEVEPRLKRHLPGYDKRNLRFSDYEDKIEDAMTRAKRTCPAGKMAHEHNPSTGVWRLIEVVG